MKYSLLLLIFACLASEPGGFKLAVHGDGKSEKLKAFASTLSYSGLSSVTALKNKFLEIYSDASADECDEGALFLMDFMEYSLDSICSAYGDILSRESIMLYCDNYIREEANMIKEDPEVKAFATEAVKNGYRFIFNEGMGDIDKAVSFPGEEVLVKLSPSLRNYYIQVSREQSEGLAHDAGLVIPLDTIAARIVWREKYLANYPMAVKKDELEESISFLAGILKYGTDNTPAFDYETGTLTPDYEGAYKRIIARYPGSSSIKELKEYYMKIKTNKYKRITD